MKIGELEATNESLKMRLNETSQINVSDEMRQRVREFFIFIIYFFILFDFYDQIQREIKDKDDVRALLDRTLQHLDTLSATNVMLQNQISKQVSFYSCLYFFNLMKFFLEQYFPI